MTTLHSAPLHPACRQQRRPLLYFIDTIMPHEELKQPSLVRSSSIIAKYVNGARPPLLKNFLRWAFTATILLVFIHSTVFSSSQHLRHPEQLVDHAIHARLAAATAATCLRESTLLRGPTLSVQRPGRPPAIVATPARMTTVNAPIRGSQLPV
jgi:hypothetical protein